MSGAILGVDAFRVTVEVDLSGGLPKTEIVGLAEAAVRESKVRVESAIKASKCRYPLARILVNLAPADMRKDGSALDLPIALGIMVATGELEQAVLEGVMVAGELSMTGELRPIRGALPIAVLTRDLGIKELLLPPQSCSEASVVDGINVRPVPTLRAAIDHLRRRHIVPAALPPPPAERSLEGLLDMRDVRGQLRARRALEVAATGGHNLLLVGPPGTGKTMLAQRLPSLLPSMSFEEALSATKVYSVMGLVPPGSGLLTRRPFRAPHSTASDVALCGGGSPPRPGEVSLAHHGVLFLDEVSLFRRATLESLRQPLEEGTVTVSRAAMSITYPARCVLVVAMNPCPCGHLNDGRKRCTCSMRDVQQYRAKISGPLLDRIDLHIEVPAITSRDLEAPPGETSAVIRARVEKARDIQRARFAGEKGVHCNAQMRAEHVFRYCPVDERAKAELRRVVDDMGMSARTHARILKVARTCADLAGSDVITFRDVIEAVTYRMLDRKDEMHAA